MIPARPPASPAGCRERSRAGRCGQDRELRGVPATDQAIRGAPPGHGGSPASRVPEVPQLGQPRAEARELRDVSVTGQAIRVDGAALPGYPEGGMP